MFVMIDGIVLFLVMCLCYEKYWLWYLFQRYRFYFVVRFLQYDGFFFVVGKNWKIQQVICYEDYWVIVFDNCFVLVDICLDFVIYWFFLLGVLDVFLVLERLFVERYFLVSLLKSVFCVSIFDSYVSIWCFYSGVGYLFYFVG